jgi:hypothetical protein
MASILPSRPRQVGPRRTIAIVASQYHGIYARAASSHAQKEIEIIAAGTEVQVLEARAFEIRWSSAGRGE